jgi:GNAT superfamily N-acetyltransferase
MRRILCRLRAIWKKGLGLLRERDWRVTLQSLRAMRHRFLFSCQRYVLLARPLDQPLPSSQSQLEVTIRQATLDDIERFERFRPITRPWHLGQFTQRLRGGQLCFITLLPDGQIVNYGWASPEVWGEPYPIPLETGDIYSSFAYTLPAYRRLGLHEANFAARCRFLRERGYQRILALVETGNVATLALCQKVGYHEIGRVTFFTFLGRTVRRYTPRQHYQM